MNNVVANTPHVTLQFPLFTVDGTNGCRADITVFKSVRNCLQTVLVHPSNLFLKLPTSNYLNGRIDLLTKLRSMISLFIALIKISQEKSKTCYGMEKENVKELISFLIFLKQIRNGRNTGNTGKSCCLVSCF